MRTREKLGLLFGLVGWAWSVVANAEPAWTTLRTEQDGLTLETRKTPDSEMPEVRITVAAALPPHALAEAAWELRNDGMQVKYLDHRKVLSQTLTERVLFLALRPPVIRPRACLLRQSRWTDASGASHIRFGTLRFKPPDDTLPFAQLRGQWSFHPSAGGGSRLVYVTLIDLGSVPAWLARGPQLDAAVATVREVMDRARAFNE
jgi:hypothetical protein